MWCAEESGCTDDRGQEIPFRGCQLKNEPMQAWGLPSASLAESMKVANSYSGYIKREHLSGPCTLLVCLHPASYNLTAVAGISRAKHTSVQRHCSNFNCALLACMTPARNTFLMLLHWCLA